MEPKEEYDVDIEKTYFGLAERMQESKSKYSNIYIKNVMKVPMREQIPIMILMVLIENISEKICEKYNFEED